MTFILIHAFFIKAISPLSIDTYKISCVLNAGAGLISIWFFIKFLDRETKPLSFYLLVIGLSVFDEIFIDNLARLFPDSFMMMFGMASLYLYETFLLSKQKRHLIFSLILLILGVTCREYIIYFAVYPLLRLSSKWGKARACIWGFVFFFSIFAYCYYFFFHFRLLFQGFIRALAYDPGAIHIGILLNLNKLSEVSGGELTLILPVVLITMLSATNRREMPFGKIFFLVAPCVGLLITFVNGKMNLRYFILANFSFSYLYAQAIHLFSQHSMWSRKFFISYRKYFVIICFIPIVLNLVSFYSNYNLLWSYSENKKKYFNNLKKIMNQNTLVIPGDYTYLVDLYIRQEKKGQLIWTNWAWKTDRFFEETVLKALSEGKRVYIDIASVNFKREAEDIRRPGLKFKYVKHDDFFHEIVKK
jgi:hypothetical protein